MQATLTSKSQITLPVAIRRKLALVPGDVLEFDESVPYIKASKPFDRCQMHKALAEASPGSPRGEARYGSRNSEGRWSRHDYGG